MLVDELQETCAEQIIDVISRTEAERLPPEPTVLSEPEPSIQERSPDVPPGEATKLKPAPAKRALPRILWSNTSLSMVEPEVLAAVATGNKPPQIFQMNGRLVRLHKGSYGDYLEVVTVDQLRHHLDRWMVFTAKRTLSKGKGTAPIPSPIDVVRDVLAMPRWDEGVFPTIERIAQSPFFTKNGALVVTPGYNAEVRVWYEPVDNLVIPPVPDNPTNEDVERAKNKLLNDYLVDFPFKGDADKANALAYLLTPFVRRMISGVVPMAIIEAPVAGTGKGLLTQCLAIPSLGQPPAITPQPESEAEFRKVITAQLVGGPAFVVFDNLAGTLRSDMLAAALTGPVWRDRELGSSRTIQVPNLCVWLGTANNLDVAGDLPRRIVWIRLDARLERPDERKAEDFQHPDIIDWGSANRGEIVHAALVLIQAWISRGKVPGTQRMGSFESWASTMGGILDVAGVPSFLANAQEKRKLVDERSLQWTTFCGTWWKEFSSSNDDTETEAVGAKDLFELAQRDDLLPWVMAAETDQGKKQKLGRELRKVTDRRFGSFQIVHVDTDSSGRHRYKLQRFGELPAEESGGVDDTRRNQQQLMRLLDDLEPADIEDMLIA